MKPFYYYLIIWKLILAICLTEALAQSVYFFRDGNAPGYYDTGLAFKTNPSYVGQTGPSGDKIPLEYNQVPYQGNNSLNITWESHPGGDWSALVIAPGFPFLNISQLDTLSFWVYSEDGLAKELLPLIYMEGAPGNTKSNKYSISDLSEDIPAKTWTHVKIPLTVFFDDPNQSSIQFNQIKAIIFGQDSADADRHALYVDEVKAYKVDGSSGIPQQPQNLSARGFDSHVELHWTSENDPGLSGYELWISSDQGNTFNSRRLLNPEDSLYIDFTRDLGTDLDLVYKLTAINHNSQVSPFSDTVQVRIFERTDEELLDMVQEATFRYFWDFAHPVSGLSRERDTSGETVTSGGSGFGIMALIVGIERGFIAYEEGRDRLLKICTFLDTADRFHGAWPHWLNGTTGKALNFGPQDDGGDLVETAFLVQGLLAAKTYFNQASAEDSSLRVKITQLWETVDWNWYRKLTNQVLYWHWSPNHGWAINHQVRGFNEAHILYLLAIASPTHSVPVSLYHQGWAGNANYTNGNEYYSYPLSVGQPNGGPLFFSHYSYMGFDPRGIKDDYANYYNRNYYHSLINWAYCVDNPKGHEGYSETSWGITASDDPFGYLAHEPGSSRDNGTISPTAALGSMPYTPLQSLGALKYFYRTLGHRLWGPMGFYDAFNMNENWFARSYLAIDQGPIINMIENHRSELLWNLFMANPEITQALTDIGFVPDANVGIEAEKFALIKVYPNPSTGIIKVDMQASSDQLQKVVVYDLAGNRLMTLKKAEINTAPDKSVLLDLKEIPDGVYLLQLTGENNTGFKKCMIQRN